MVVAFSSSTKNPRQPLTASHSNSATTRSLPVAFQTRSYFYNTTKSNNSTPDGRRCPASARKIAYSRRLDVDPLSDSESGSSGSTSGTPRGVLKGGRRKVSPAVNSPSSPAKVLVTPARAGASPLQGRSGGRTSVAKPGLAPSIISFAAEVRRSKKGESRIDEAHLLRILHNRHLQWRFANARAKTAQIAQISDAEKKLHDTWIDVSKNQTSVTIKRMKIQVLAQNLKLASILRGQMAYLEEWSLMDREHSDSLSGSAEALKASTLRLPVVSGARAEGQDVTEAVGSAVDVMQAMTSSIRSLSIKAEGASSAISELGKVAAQEQALLHQAKEILSMVATLHVKQCSLQTQTLQLRGRTTKL